MRVRTLQIKNFRNILGLEKEFKPSGAIIYGKNGTGKTNLLEAISYCAFGKSIRSVRDSDLINFSQTFFRLEANFIFEHNNITITAANDSKQKIITLDEVKLDKLSELYKYAKVVYFSPEDIDLISGGPIYRRKFIDLAISQSKYQYLEELRFYHRVLKQRNVLLKNKINYKEKAVWDRKLVKSGSEIIKYRLEYLNNFIPNLCDKYFFVSGEKEDLSVKYKFSFPNVSDCQLQDAFSDHLELIEPDEIRMQRTLAGPHLDDLEFMIKNRSARSFGSQGQKRSLAITCRLVQADMIKRSDGEAPILMFDDVLADLDRKRALRIMNLLGKEHQIFIATPNEDLYKDFDLEAFDLEKILDEE